MYLGYNSEQNRWGILSGDLWVDPGLHCGQRLEVETPNGKILTRLEMTHDGIWYLYDTEYRGSDLEGLIVHIPGKPDKVVF